MEEGMLVGLPEIVGEIYEVWPKSESSTVYPTMFCA